MMQALLMLAIVISFMPIIVNKMDKAKQNQENAAVSSQLLSAFDASQRFLHEEVDNLTDGIKTFSDDSFTEKLEPFGLPLGFVTKTNLGQTISLIISKDGKNVFAVIRAHGGKLSEFRRAEITSRIGFWGAITDDKNIVHGSTGGWEVSKLPNNLILDSNDIYIRVPEDEEFSDLVAINTKSPEKNPFHANLKMDDNTIGSIKLISANSGEIKNVSTNDFLLSGIEGDKKNKNEIDSIKTGKAIFKSDDKNPLSILRSNLSVDSLVAKSVGVYGELPTLFAVNVSAKDFNMRAGQNNFSGPIHWDIKKDADFTNVTLSVERLSISSFLDTSRGQDAFLNATGTDIVYTYGSGIRTDVIKTDNIIMRNQISSELLNGGTGPTLLEIRPAATSVLPDILLEGISNDSLKIPISAKDNLGKMDSCKNIIGQLGSTYNSESLSDNIVCQFVLYNRIEKRIMMKKCLLSGGTNCI